MIRVSLVFPSQKNDGQAHIGCVADVVSSGILCSGNGHATKNRGFQMLSRFGSNGSIRRFLKGVWTYAFGWL
jgi:hypothetical protein